ncbi:hypothetical protein BaRGS_00002457 [Batillaria attramentaria]|uniref:Uncharacterized protein n=1 Tax=Batillaria attramentaria TaxID=370345 RepID=A0ABD0M379_9CAEN
MKGWKEGGKVKEGWKEGGKVKEGVGGKWWRRKVTECSIDQISHYFLGLCGMLIMARGYQPAVAESTAREASAKNAQFGTSEVQHSLATLGGCCSEPFTSAWPRL